MSIKGLEPYQRQQSVSLSPPGARSSDKEEQASRKGSTAGTGALDRVSLSKEALALIEQLKSRDLEVKTHEQAHISAGGYLAGSATYTYQTGPDGRRYAVGGEVPIDSSPVADDPRATISKMGIVKRAALAPAKPSSQDLRVAAKAEAVSVSAQADLVKIIQQGGHIEKIG